MAAAASADPPPVGKSPESAAVGSSSSSAWPKPKSAAVRASAPSGGPLAGCSLRSPRARAARPWRRRHLVALGRRGARLHRPARPASARRHRSPHVDQRPARAPVNLEGGDGGSRHSNRRDHVHHACAPDSDVLRSRPAQATAPRAICAVVGQQGHRLPAKTGRTTRSPSDRRPDPERRHASTAHTLKGQLGLELYGGHSPPASWSASCNASRR